jgi:hypothetical protein
MTDRSKFEQMLEYLISEEQEKAKEIFHQLVVEKSREIYEQILSEDFQVNEEDDEDDEQQDEAVESDEEELEEASDEEDEPEGGEDDGEVGGDATDDFMGDVDSDEEGDEDGAEGEGDLEDRVMDLEDALDDLRAEFEQMMGDEGGMDDMGGDDMGMGGDDMGMGGDDMDMEPELPVKDSFDVSDNFMREYIEKVSEPKHGDDGVNTKSIVAGKNDMGGTTANMVKSHVENGKGGTQGGLLNPSAKDMNTKNINVPGGKAGKTAFKTKEPGHGAEKKGAAEQSDRSADSVLNGAPKRAK